MSSEKKYESLGAKQLEELQLLEKEYPYFALPFGVNAKKSQADKDLLQAALRSKDRNTLRKFIELSVLQNAEPKKELIFTPVFSKVKEEIIEDKKTVNASTSSTTSAKIQIAEKTSEKVKISEEEIEEISVNETSAGEPKSFTSWLSFLEPEIAEKTTQNVEILKPQKDELEQLIAANAQLALFAKTIEEETHYANDLNSFLIREKRKKQKKSAPKPKEIVSETLANLYVAQGFKDRAIEVYEKLILKNPEKSAFFAVQIEKLKQ